MARAGCRHGIKRSSAAARQDHQPGVVPLFGLAGAISVLVASPSRAGGAQSSSTSSVKPWLSTNLPFCMIGTNRSQDRACRSNPREPGVPLEEHPKVSSAFQSPVPDRQF
jgi:hypothetical protein